MTPLSRQFLHAAIALSSPTTASTNRRNRAALSIISIPKLAIALLLPVSVLTTTASQAYGNESKPSQNVSQNAIPDVIAILDASPTSQGTETVVDKISTSEPSGAEIVEVIDTVNAVNTVGGWSEESPIAEKTNEGQLWTVNPNGNATFKTITQALAIAQSGDTIQLAKGTYSKATGEQFPLVIPEGVTVIGDEISEGKEVKIIGGGHFLSRTFARQNVSMVVNKDNIKISGLSVSNPNIRGTGLWIESGNPTVKFSRFHESHRDGIFVTGSATPTIHNSLFHKNGGNGISIARNASGEIRDNWFQATGFGLAIGDGATPMIIGNQILNNNDGIIVSGSARPILRSNVISKNIRSGMVAIANAAPDLGTTADPGQNQWIDNGKYHFQNATQTAVSAIGNQFNGGLNFGTLITQ